VNVAKTDINSHSNNLAIGLGTLGVTSNVIAPGPIRNTEGMDILTLKADSEKENRFRILLGRQGSVKMSQMLPRISCPTQEIMSMGIFFLVSLSSCN